MADNVTIPATGTGDATPIIATDEIGGVDHQLVKIEWGADGVATVVSAANPLPVVQTGTPTLPTGAATQTTSAAILAALGTPAQAGGLTDTQLRATAVPVSGTITANVGTGTQAVSGTVTATGPLTDAQLRATAVPVSGSFTGTTDLTATGNFTTSGQQVSITTLNGMAVCDIDISGTFTGFTCNIQGTIDGTNWFSFAGARDMTTIGSSVFSGSSQITALGKYQVPITGLAGFRLNSTAVGSGTVVVALRASSASGTAMTFSGSLPIGSNIIGQVQITDGLGGGNAAVVSVANALKVDPSGVTSPVSLASVPSHAVTNAGTFAVQAATELATGLTTFSNTALSNTKTQVKASAGKLYGWMIHNPAAATTFMQVWDVASGAITVGTTAPTYVIPIPAGASANVMGERGITHVTAINIAATTTATNAIAPGTALCVGLFYV